MIAAINITGIAYEVDDVTRKYVNKRLGRLDKYIPKNARSSVTVDVKLAEINHDHGNKYQAEAVINVPGKVITAKDSTGNMLAAIDIVEAKLQVQLTEYKQTSIAHVGNRGAMSNFKRSFKREL
jgi:putative sigma-54 modulation protein